MKEKVKRLNITKRFLPKGREYGRTGAKMVPTSVTIHNTANENADAEAHARYLEGGRGISWHYTVDADSIVQHIPVNEQAWHTGTYEGNTTSIGIEVCEYSDKVKARRAEANAAWLAAALLKSIKTVKRVRTHKSWSGKECPRDILPHWNSFLNLVDKYTVTATKRKPKAKYGFYKVVNVNALNLRTRPMGSIIKVIPKGTRVKQVAPAANGWMKVRYGMRVGFMATEVDDKPTLKKM